jgi:hypothetical protein
MMEGEETEASSLKQGGTVGGGEEGGGGRNGMSVCL